MNGSAKGCVKPSTLEGYERMIRNHIKPALGHRKLKALAPDHVQYFYSPSSTPASPPAASA